MPRRLSIKLVNEPAHNRWAISLGGGLTAPAPVPTFLWVPPIIGTSLPLFLSLLFHFLSLSLLSRPIWSAIYSSKCLHSPVATSIYQDVFFALCRTDVYQLSVDNLLRLELCLRWVFSSLLALIDKTLLRCYVPFGLFPIAFSKSSLFLFTKMNFVFDTLYLYNIYIFTSYFFLNLSCYLLRSILPNGSDCFWVLYFCIFP